MAAVDMLLVVELGLDVVELARAAVPETTEAYEERRGMDEKDGPEG